MVTVTKNGAKGTHSLYAFGYDYLTFILTFSCIIPISLCKSVPHIIQSGPNNNEYKIGRFVKFKIFVINYGIYTIYLFCQVRDFKY